MRLLFACLIIILSVAHPLFAADEPMMLSLKSALTRAQSISVNILVANARVQQSLSQINQAQSSLLPQLSASLNGQRQSRDLRMSGITIPNMPPYTGPFNTFDARAKITQTIFDAGTLERLKTARLSNKLSAVQLQKAREDALALVAVLYIQAKRAAEQANATKIFVDRDKRAYHLMKTEYDQGTKTLLELKKAKAEYYQSRYVLKTAFVQAKERRLDLAAALQIDANTSIAFDLKEDLELLTKNNLNVPKESLDVTVAQQQLTMAESLVNASKADNYPRVSLIGDYGRAGESPSEASNTYTIGIMATVPIWQGGNQQAKVAEAKAKADEAKALLVDAKFQSSTGVMDAIANIEKAKALIQAEQAQMEVSRQELALVQEQLQIGMAQELDVMRARAQAIYDMDQYKEAVAVLWTSQISLAKAQGQMQHLLR